MLYTIRSASTRSSFWTGLCNICVQRWFIIKSILFITLIFLSKICMYSSSKPEKWALSSCHIYSEPYPIAIAEISGKVNKWLKYKPLHCIEGITLIYAELQLDCIVPIVELCAIARVPVTASSHNFAGGSLAVRPTDAPIGARRSRAIPEL